MIGSAARQSRHRIRKLRISHACLDVRDAILQIDPENVIHAGGGDDHAVFVSDASAGQAGAGAAGDDWNIHLRQQLHDLADLLAGRRKTNSSRDASADGKRIKFVNI